MNIHTPTMNEGHSYSVSMNFNPEYESFILGSPEEPEVKEGDSLGIEP